MRRACLFGLLIAFASQAFAVLPVGVLVGELLFGTLARSAFTSTTALGSVVAWVVPKTTDSPDPSSSTGATIEVQLDPNAPLTQDIPTGWTSPSGGAIQPTPPGSMSATLGFTYNGTRYTDCTAMAQAFASNTGQVLHHATYSAPTCFIYIQPNGSSPQTSVDFTNSCPTGYTLSGSTCNLTNAAAVPKPADGKCNILRTGNTFTGDTRDPDCSSTSISNSGVQLTSDTVKVGDANKQVEVKLNPDGTSIVKEKTSDTGTNTTTEKTTHIGADNKVTGTSSNQYTGTGTGQSTTPIGSGSNIDVSSLNKEATQGAISNKLSQIHNDITTAPDTSTLQTEKDALDAKYDELIDNISALGESGINSAGTSFTWFPDLPSATCTPLSYGVPGHMYTIDHCETAARVRAIAGYVFYIFTGFLLFAVLTGKNSGE